MPTKIERQNIFPAGLLEWAGHRSGGVRRLFDNSSGRPAGNVIRTRLLDKLTSWADQLVADHATVPRVVLLAGGPGNGKTEALEVLVRHLDDRLGLNELLINTTAGIFSPTAGVPVPRCGIVNLSEWSAGRLPFQLRIVQDASVASEEHGRSPAELFVEELADAVASPTSIYLCCVNRGILDDALIYSIEGGRSQIRDVIESVVKALGGGVNPPACWPLEGRADIAVWPMDVESLFVSLSNGEPSPASQLLTVATHAHHWPEVSRCAAGDRCPFCTSRRQLAESPHKDSLLKILRWYELAAGKRWSFRDLFSLISYFLAGEPSPDGRAIEDPCAWAAMQIELTRSTETKLEASRAKAPFVLVSAQYQHAMFGVWSRHGLRAYRQDLKDLRLEKDETLIGLFHFLNSPRAMSLPATLRPQLEWMCQALDPALGDPDSKVDVSKNTTIRFRDIDVRFSHSTKEGFEFVRKYKFLSPLELDLLKRLADADERLSSSDVRRRRPTAATRVQSFIRDFSGRIVRRSVGSRSAVVQDSSTLSRYQQVIDGDPALLHDAVSQVSQLLNTPEGFLVSLNTTFGEPAPPESRKAFLITQKQRVKSIEKHQADRPVSAMQFLAIGPANESQAIPLTYDLFRSVVALRSGMLPASLPRPVVALLDATRARLAGLIVRDEDLLDEAEIHVGRRDEVIFTQAGRFVVRKLERAK